MRVRVCVCVWVEWQDWWMVAVLGFPITKNAIYRTGCTDRKLHHKEMQSVCLLTSTQCPSRKCVLQRERLIFSSFTGLCKQNEPRWWRISTLAATKRKSWDSITVSFLAWYTWAEQRRAEKKADSSVACRRLMWGREQRRQQCRTCRQCQALLNCSCVLTICFAVSSCYIISLALEW